MIRKSVSSEESPKATTDSPSAPNQSWIDRLNKNNRVAHQNKLAGSPVNITEGNINSSFGNTTPSSSARKTRKGFRAG